jgi:alpha(1,3/1,4) fucosyltransferase
MLGSVFADGHANNSFFEEHDPTHRFNPTVTNRLLRDEFARRGIELNTADVNAGRQVDFELHFEGRPLQPSAVPRFLVALENPYINPLNANVDYFANFQRVFSWDRRFIGHVPNVQEIAYGIHFVVPPWPSYEEREIFSCLINANKRFKTTLPNDLYVERVAVIRWHERHAPDDFALYGLGWNKPRHEASAAGRLQRRAQRLATQLFGYRPFPLWKGEVANKAEVLLRCRFSYCYENVHSLTGYVTEKIFDSLMNGCVPVYWGADDIADQVDAECFIDRRNFRDTAEVHAHLRRMSRESYARTQQAGRNYLAGARAKRFSAAHFARTLAASVEADIGAALRSSNSVGSLTMGIQEFQFRDQGTR